MDQFTDRHALDRLERKLKEATSQRGTNDRAAAIDQLRAVLDFFDQKPEWTTEEIHRPLLDLWLGLIDLDDGRVVPLLSPKRFENRPPDDRLRQMARGHAMVAVEQLVATGVSANAAARKVVEVWNKCTGETISPATVKSWYDRRNKLAKADLGYQVLAHYREFLDAGNLDRTSAEIVKSVLRRTGLEGDLQQYLPPTETEILTRLATSLTVIKPRHDL